MIKFNITSERFAEACSILDYLGVTNGSKDAIVRIAHRFVTGKDGEFIVKVVYDEDGDIERFENTEIALLLLKQVTPKRLERLINEFSEAARQIVDPPKGGGLKEQSSTVTGQPPPG